MKIILNERAFSSLIDNILNETHNPLNQKIEIAIDTLKRLIARDGVVMTNIENGKDYSVYEILSLTNEIGKRYCICQLIKDGKPYGSIYTKPLDMFKMKIY